VGFIQNLLQQSQQGQQQQGGIQSRLQGQGGLLESLRNMQGPSQNLPSPSQAQQGGSAPFGGFGGAGAGGIMDMLRQRLGQQGLGGMAGNNTPLVNPRMPTPQIPGGGTPIHGGIGSGGSFPNWPIHVGQPGPQMPQKPMINPRPPSTINITQMPGYTPTGPSMAPTTPQVNPRPAGGLPTVGGTRTNPTYTGGGFATGDPQPSAPQQPAPTQSRYGSLSGVQKPTFRR